MIVLILAVAGLIALFELPRLYRNQLWGELATVILFLLAGLAIALPTAMGIFVPSPIKPLEAMFMPIYEAIKAALVPAP